MSFTDIILSEFINSTNLCSKNNSFYIDGQTYTYVYFSQRISAIREVIQSSNNTEKICAIAIHDDIETYASIFALWMEGKAYVPLHPNQPLERNLNIIEQVGIKTVLDSAEHSVFSEHCNVINSSKCEYTEDYLDNWVEVDDNELAYILFTSGSTGIPKGVQITRGNVAAFMDSFWETGIKIDENDRCLQVFDLTFDVSVQSYLVALTRGACVYTVPYGQVKYLYAASLIQEQKITFGAMAPSMLTYLRPYFDEFDATSMQTTILTAEACPVDLMEDWFKCAKNTEIYDFYGPTEATIYCTYYKLTKGGNNMSQNGIISIGKPLKHVGAIIIDEDGNIVNDSAKGELCVSGAQVTPGYWNNPERNEASFFIKEINGQEVRFYHTGDLCYYGEGGNILYCGRIDQQAKIQGFRVELGEIEFHARDFYNKEKRVVAIAFDNDKKLTEIALFIESSSIDEAKLLEYLRSKMPHYMIPSRIICLNEFPLNKSEKIDRNELKKKL